MTALHLIVHGKVQGVFYRDWTIDTACSLSITGWVRNLPDGTVEAHLEGEPQAVRRMIEAMRDGPPRAQVQRIEETEVAPQGFGGFERR